jgi:hypothetical protein
MKSFLFMTLLLGLAAAANASIITMDPACPTTGTYQTLLDTNAAGGCFITVGGGAFLQFSDFTYTPAGTGTPAASGVGYSLDDPGTGVGGDTIWGFEFNPGLVVAGTPTTPNVIQDILITYKVVAVGTEIMSDHLFANAFASGAGLGLVSEDLTFCTRADLDPTLGTCHMFSGNPLLVSTSSSLSDVRHFAAWTSMTVSKDINVSSGMVGGVAEISQVRDSVDLTTPEPGTWALLALGGLLIGISRFRSRTQN